MSYIIFAWMTSMTYGLGSVVGKIATKHHIKNPWLYNIVWWILTVICIAPFAIASGVGWPQDWQSMLWLGVANMVSGALFILAFYAVDLSILSPLANVRTPITALVGVLLFGEMLPISQFVLIGVIFLAGMFVYMDERFSVHSFFTKGSILAFLWVVSSVWFNAMIKEASLHNGFWEVSLWSSVLGLVFTLPTAPLFLQDLKNTPLKRYTGVSLSSIFFTAGFLFSVKALAQNVSISMAIISLPLAMVMTMALSFFRPKILEKHTPKVYAIRFVSAAVMFLAALWLSK